MCVPNFQKAQRAIDDIEKKVRKITITANTYYVAGELSPFLDNLDKSIEDTVTVMDDLTNVLQCPLIFRLVIIHNDIYLLSWGRKILPFFNDLIYNIISAVTIITH